jgi:hypothetical protein
MISRKPMLTELPYRMVRLACDLCPRRGQYRKETLVARFGGDVLMTDVRTSLRNAHARMRRGIVSSNQIRLIVMAITAAAEGCP